MVLLSGFHGGSTLLHGLDDVLIARATAQIAFELLAYFGFSRLGMALTQIDRAHDHAGRAKTALQAMALFEGGLHGVQGAICGREAFDGGDLGDL